MVMAEATNHYFKHLGVSDGLSQVCIPSIYQDELGAVWLGTTEGLNRYNGKDVKVLYGTGYRADILCSCAERFCGESTLCRQRDCMGGYQKILGRNIT